MNSARSFPTARAVLLLSSLALAACQSKSACVKNGVVAEVAGSHPHALEIPTDHVERAVGGTYPVKGDDHSHVVALTDANMAQLKAGTPVTTRASSVNAHTHEITIRCKE
jgi:hypothetical protein